METAAVKSPPTKSRVAMWLMVAAGACCLAILGVVLWDFFNNQLDSFALLVLFIEVYWSISLLSGLLLLRNKHRAWVCIVSILSLTVLVSVLIIGSFFVYYLNHPYDRSFEYGLFIGFLMFSLTPFPFALSSLILLVMDKGYWRSLRTY